MSKEDHKLRLHSYRRCPFAIRVRMTLHEKGLEFETIEEDLKKKSDDLLKRHPEAKVPVLLHGDTVLYESAVITEYLEDTFPDPKLMPASPAARAEVRLWTHWCNQGFKPHVDAFKYGTARVSEAQAEQAEPNLRADLAKLESALTQSSWLLGMDLTLADIHVFPFLRQLSKVNGSETLLGEAPQTKSWLERLLARKSFVHTMEKKA